MKLPVPNLTSPIVDKLGKVIPPWNSWFQQFSQKPAAINTLVVGVSPFSFTASNPGTIDVIGGTVTSLVFIRGTTSINFGAVTNRAIPVSSGDIIVVTYSVIPTIYFIES
jgi:hypothetical protein